MHKTNDMEYQMRKERCYKSLVVELLNKYEKKIRIFTFTINTSVKKH